MARPGSPVTALALSPGGESAIVCTLSGAWVVPLVDFFVAPPGDGPSLVGALSGLVSFFGSEPSRTSRPVTLSGEEPAAAVVWWDAPDEEDPIPHGCFGTLGGVIRVVALATSREIFVVQARGEYLRSFSRGLFPVERCLHDPPCRH